MNIGKYLPYFTSVDLDHISTLTADWPLSFSKDVPREQLFLLDKEKVLTIIKRAQGVCKGCTRILNIIEKCDASENNPGTV